MIRILYTYHDSYIFLALNLKSTKELIYYIKVKIILQTNDIRCRSLSKAYIPVSFILNSKSTTLEKKFNQKAKSKWLLHKWNEHNSLFVLYSYYRSEPICSCIIDTFMHHVSNCYQRCFYQCVCFVCLYLFSNLRFEQWCVYTYRESRWYF